MGPQFPGSPQISVLYIYIYLHTSMHVHATRITINPHPAIGELRNKIRDRGNVYQKWPKGSYSAKYIWRIGWSPVVVDRCVLGKVVHTPSVFTVSCLQSGNGAAFANAEGRLSRS